MRAVYQGTELTEPPFNPFSFASGLDDEPAPHHSDMPRKIGLEQCYQMLFYLLTKSYNMLYIPHE